MKNFSKVLRIGTMKVWDKKLANIFVKVEYENGRLSMSGVIGPKRNGDCLGSAGQIDMEFKHRNTQDDDDRYSEPTRPEDINFAQGWDADLWLTVLDIWKAWHLNDMHAGCEHQRELGWERDGYEKHPSEPCPTCGYRFGSAWKEVAVPEGVLAFLANLPDADQEPAWV